MLFNFNEIFSWNICVWILVGNNKKKLRILTNVGDLFPFLKFWNLQLLSFFDENLYNTSLLELLFKLSKENVNFSKIPLNFSYLLYNFYEILYETSIYIPTWILVGNKKKTIENSHKCAHHSPPLLKFLNLHQLSYFNGNLYQTSLLEFLFKTTKKNIHFTQVGSSLLKI